MEGSDCVPTTEFKNRISLDVSSPNRKRGVDGFPELGSELESNQASKQVQKRMASLLDGHFQEIGQDERPKRRPSGAAESARSRVQKKTVEDDVDDDDDTNDNGDNGVKV